MKDAGEVTVQPIVRIITGPRLLAAIAEKSSKGAFGILHAILDHLDFGFWIWIADSRARFLQANRKSKVQNPKSKIQNRI